MRLNSTQQTELAEIDQCHRDAVTRAKLRGVSKSGQRFVWGGDDPEDAWNATLIEVSYRMMRGKWKPKSRTHERALLHRVMRQEMHRLYTTTRMEMLTEEEQTSVLQPEVVAANYSPAVAAFFEEVEETRGRPGEAMRTLVDLWWNEGLSDREVIAGHSERLCRHMALRIGKPVQPQTMADYVKRARRDIWARMKERGVVRGELVNRCKWNHHERIGL